MCIECHEMSGPGKGYPTAMPAVFHFVQDIKAVKTTIPPLIPWSTYPVNLRGRKVVNS